MGVLLLASLLLRACAPLAAQAGDRIDEPQAELTPELLLPPPEPLAPDEERATFALPEGLSIELVACEPLVVAPIAATFDERARLWVVEMPGFMPEVDGKGELEPSGAIVVLEDTDRDGRMDRRTVFLDGLVLPRSVQPCHGGALVIAPPELFFARDVDGDGRAEERVVIERSLAGLDSPEHAPNGFVLTDDGWWRAANIALEWRLVDGAWTRRATAGGGQWGITQDAAGRVLYNTNSDPLRGDLFPSCYAVRNPNLGVASGVNVRIASDVRVFPSHLTPGVNRGYRPATLREGRLAEFTAACGPLVYGGDMLEALRGQAFVCEPAGNLVKRYRLVETDSFALVAQGIDSERDFLTSTDERFRPVNLCDGPDGALYVVDMYRGVLQHRMFVTSFLRRQILARELEQPLDRGRIWRIVPAGGASRGFTDLPDAVGSDWSELAHALSHSNGWMRKRAAALFLEEGVGDRAAIAALEAEIERGKGGTALALSTRAALGALERKDLLRWIGATHDPRVLRTCFRIAEPLLASDAVLAGVVQLAARRAIAAGERGTFHQALLSLTAAATPAGSGLLAALAALDMGTPELRTALVSGLRGRELEFLRVLLGRADFGEPAGGRRDLLALLASCIVREGVTERILGLLEELSGLGVDWRAEAIGAGMLAARPRRPDGAPGRIPLTRAPEERASASAGPHPIVMQVLEVLNWPGREVDPAEIVAPLSSEDQGRFEQGARLYGTLCASCHQPSGLGEPGKAPSLRGARFVLGSEERLTRILLHGIEGPLEIEGTIWSQEMPAPIASDAELAALMTYLRREWGHGATPVREELVRALREASRERARPWTVEELGNE